MSSAYARKDIIISSKEIPVVKLSQRSNGSIHRLNNIGLNPSPCLTPLSNRIGLV